MTRSTWWLFALAACKGADGMPIGGDAAPQTACTTNTMCRMDQYCAPATKTCEAVLELRGFTATVEPFTCMPPGQTSRQCAAYRTSFVLHDHSPTELVMRLERIALMHPSGFSVTAASHCAGAPWMIQAASMSSILDVEFDFRGGPQDGGWPAWSVPCGASTLTPEIIDDLGPAPTTGELSIVASLRMSGGALIEARASATMTPQP